MKRVGKKWSRDISFAIIIVFIFTLLTAKLAYLQVVKADYYKEVVNNKAATEIPDFATRGKIVDKNNVELAANNQSYNLIYTETKESKLKFFDTMNSVFKILDENGAGLKDEFPLKIDEYRFEFKAGDDDEKKKVERLFKRDRGMNSVARKELIEKKVLEEKEKSSEESEQKIDEQLLKYTPKETFEYLVDLYDLTPLDCFVNELELYKQSPNEMIGVLAAKYKLSSASDIKDLLDKYVEAKKDSKVYKELLVELAAKCGVDKLNYNLNLQRKYMLIKDAIKLQYYSGYKPITIATNIGKDTAFIISQKLNELPGIDITLQPIRKYPQGEAASAVVGYISKINSYEKDRYEEKGYDVNADYIGVAGIEKAYEGILKGSKGGRIVKLNKYGRVMEELGERESHAGNDIKLTLDIEMQKVLEGTLDKVMKDLQARGRKHDVDTSNATRGAVVVVDVNTGAILAMVSRPGFNPNDFVKGLSTEQYNKYFTPDFEGYASKMRMGYDKDKLNSIFPLYKDTNLRYDPDDILPKPLYNYAAYSLVPPGSTFKPVTAVAGLETGVINTSERIQDTGVFSDGKIKPISFQGVVNGPVNMKSAIALSSNPYFMTVAQRLRENYNDDILAEYAYKFGLGANPNNNSIKSTGIEIGENFGQVFNTWSIKDRFSNSTWWSIRSTLKSGKGPRYNSSFTPIDLYSYDNDSDSVKKLKEEIEKVVKEAVKSGTFSIDNCKNLISQLVSEDPKYKNVKISKTEISAIANEIQAIAVFDGHTEATTPENIYDAAIGQSISTFTPLQLANYAATLANGGNRYKLHVVDEIKDPSGDIVLKNKAEILEKLNLKPSTIEAVRSGMRAVDEEGTGSQVFSNFPIETAGKTGSATYKADQEKIGRTSYGVYIGFAPYDKPEIAVSVVVLDGGHGGDIAPVAKAAYEQYFKERLAKEFPNYKPEFVNK